MTPPLQKPDAIPAVPIAELVAEDRRTREQLCQQEFAAVLAKYRCRAIVQRTEQFGGGDPLVRWSVVIDALP